MSYRNEQQQPDNIISADSSEDVFKGNSEDSLKDKMIKGLSQELGTLKTEKYHIEKGSITCTVIVF